MIIFAFWGECGYRTCLENKFKELLTLNLRSYKNGSIIMKSRILIKDFLRIC